MKLIIETYWNKVIPPTQNGALGEVLPEYELKDRVTYPTSWEPSEWRKSAKGSP